jgi:hypothetical protein
MHLREPGCRVVFAGGAAIPLLHIRRNTAQKERRGFVIWGPISCSSALKRRVATVAPKAPPKDSAL